MDFGKMVKNYGVDVEHLEVSPFELIDMFHTRSVLEKNIELLTNEEKVELNKYDLILLENAEKVVASVKKIYNFDSSDEPLNEWWWHLEKVSKGELCVSLGIRNQNRAIHQLLPLEETEEKRLSDETKQVDGMNAVLSVYGTDAMKPMIYKLIENIGVERIERSYEILIEEEFRPEKIMELADELMKMLEKKGAGVKITSVEIQKVIEQKLK